MNDLLFADIGFQLRFDLGPQHIEAEQAELTLKELVIPNPLLVPLEETDKHLLEISIEAVESRFFRQGLRIPVETAVDDLQLSLAKCGQLVILEVFQKA